MTTATRLGTLLCLLLLLAIVPEDVSGRRGRHKIRNKQSRADLMQLSGGKFRDKDSHNYYNHKDGAKIIKASHFDYEFILGHKIKFMCSATGNPRPAITWYKDGVELFSHLYTTVHEFSNETHLVSKLEIDPATQMDAGIYECSADNKYSVDRRSFKTDFSIIFD